MASIKLILHSDQSVEKTLKLDKKLLPSLSSKRVPTIGYMPSIPDPKRKYFLEKQYYYNKAGLSDIEYFDVEDDHTEEEIVKFFNRDVIHLASGSPEVFLDRLCNTGYIKHVIAAATAGKVMVGVSAGAMLLGPTIGVIPFLKKHTFVNLNALNMVDFEVFPHWDGKTASAFDIGRYVKKNNRKVYAISDGDCIVVNGSKITFHGDILEILADGTTKRVNITE